jgi:sister chromatid cohesion protein PDS5
MLEGSDQPSKKARTQINTVIREKSSAKSRVKSSKPKTKAAPRQRKYPVPDIDPAERRRSSRTHNVSTYKERDDEDDEAEMMDGVAEWDYLNEDSDDGSEEGSDCDEDGGNVEDDGDEKSGDDDSETEVPRGARGGRASKAKSAGAPAVKASVLSRKGRAGPSSRSRGKPADQDDSDMEVDDEDNDSEY